MPTELPMYELRPINMNWRSVLSVMSLLESARGEKCPRIKLGASSNLRLRLAKLAALLRSPKLWDLPILLCHPVRSGRLGPIRDRAMGPRVEPVSSRSELVCTVIFEPAKVCRGSRRR